MENRYIRCKNCEQFHRELTPCPSFDIYQCDIKDNYYDIKASDFEEAAEKAAERYNEDDTTFGEHIVTVTLGEETRTFAVEASVTINYSTVEIQKWNK